MSTTTTPSRENQEDRGLGAGYIVTIILGVIAALALLVVLVLWYRRRKQRKQQQKKIATWQADYQFNKARTTIGRAPEAKTFTKWR